MKSSKIVDAYRAYVLSLPEAREEMKWGSPHFTVNKKLFGGLGEYEGRPTAGVVIDRDLAASLIDDHAFYVAPYTGKYGGITMELSRVPLAQAKLFARMSYERVAPKKLVALLKGDTSPPAKAPPRKAAAKKKPAAKRAKK